MYTRKITQSGKICAIDNHTREKVHWAKNEIVIWNGVNEHHTTSLEVEITYNNFTQRYTVYKWFVVTVKIQKKSIEKVLFLNIINPLPPSDAVQ